MFGKNIMNWQIAEKGARFDIEVEDWKGSTYSVIEMGDGSTLISFIPYESPVGASNSGTFRVTGTDGGGDIEYLVVGSGGNSSYEKVNVGGGVLFSVYGGGGGGAVLSGSVTLGSTSSYKVRAYKAASSGSWINGTDLLLWAKGGGSPINVSDVVTGGISGETAVRFGPTSSPTINTPGSSGSTQSYAWYNTAGSYPPTFFQIYDLRSGGGGGASKSTGGTPSTNGYGYGGSGVTSSITGQIITYGVGGEGGCSTPMPIDPDVDNRSNGLQDGSAASVYFAPSLPTTIRGVSYTTNPCLVPASTPSSYGGGANGGAYAGQYGQSPPDAYSISASGGRIGIVYIRYTKK